MPPRKRGEPSPEQPSPREHHLSDDAYKETPEYLRIKQKAEENIRAGFSPDAAINLALQIAELEDFVDATNEVIAQDPTKKEREDLEYSMRVREISHIERILETHYRAWSSRDERGTGEVIRMLFSTPEGVLQKHLYDRPEVSIFIDCLTEALNDNEQKIAELQRLITTDPFLQEHVPYTAKDLVQTVHDFGVRAMLWEGKLFPVWQKKSWKEMEEILLAMEFTKEELRVIYFAGILRNKRSVLQNSHGNAVREWDTKAKNVIKARNVAKDLAQIFDCKEDEVAISSALQGKNKDETMDTKIFYGRFIIDDLLPKDVNGKIHLPKIVLGSVVYGNDFTKFDDIADKKINLIGERIELNRDIPEGKWVNIELHEGCTKLEITGSKFASLSNKDHGINIEGNLIDLAIKMKPLVDGFLVPESVRKLTFHADPFWKEKELPESMRELAIEENHNDDDLYNDVDYEILQVLPRIPRKLKKLKVNIYGENAMQKILEQCEELEELALLKTYEIERGARPRKSIKKFTMPQLRILPVGWEFWEGLEDAHLPGCLKMSRTNTCSNSLRHLNLEAIRVLPRGFRLNEGLISVNIEEVDPLPEELTFPGSLRDIRLLNQGVVGKRVLPKGAAVLYRQRDNYDPWGE